MDLYKNINIERKEDSPQNFIEGLEDIPFYISNNHVNKKVIKNQYPISSNIKPNKKIVFDKSNRINNFSNIGQQITSKNINQIKMNRENLIQNNHNFDYNYKDKFYFQGKIPKKEKLQKKDLSTLNNNSISDNRYTLKNEQNKFQKRSFINDELNDRKRNESSVKNSKKNAKNLSDEVEENDEGILSRKKIL